MRGPWEGDDFLRRRTPMPQIHQPDVASKITEHNNDLIGHRNRRGLRWSIYREAV
jgi:hypothetical protein